MELKLVNEILNSILNASTYNLTPTGLKKVGKEEGHQGIGSYGEAQDEYNEEIYFFNHPELPENIFIRVTTETDSYDENVHIASIQFVEGKAKTVTVYEPV